MIFRTSILALTLLFSGCAHFANTHADSTVNHVVLIWLKDSGNEEQRQKVITASNTLADIPGLEAIQIGSSIPSDRKIVDDSFDVGVYMQFKDEATMNRYISNPQHINVVKTHVMPLADKIVIYDF